MHMQQTSIMQKGRKKMPLYEKVNTDLNFVGREKEIEKFWEENKIFEKSMKIREGCPKMCIRDRLQPDCVAAGVNGAGRKNGEGKAYIGF